MTADRVARAAAWLDDADLAPLVARLHRRLSSGQPVRSVGLDGLTGPQAEAVAGLLRRTRVARRTRVRLDHLTAALHLRGLDEVVAAVETVAGPVGDRAADAATDKAARRAATRALVAHTGAAAPELSDWARRQVRAVGGDLHARVALVTRVVDVIADARARRTPVPVPVAAAAAFGDPHALDGDTAAGGLLRRACAHLAGTDGNGTLSVRAALGAAGLADDELSSTVLAWRVTGHPHPAAFTLEQVRDGLLDAPPGGRVLVVENPSVVQVAAARDHAGALLCASGTPSAACQHAVERLAGAGVRVDAHADFDIGGIHVLTTLAAAGATPWRMGAADYTAASARASVPITGRVPPTPWDAGLADQLRRRRLAVFEEQLVDQLLA